MGNHVFMHARAWHWLAAGSAGCGVLLLVLVELRWAPLHTADRAAAVWAHRVAHAEPGWTAVNLVLTNWVWDPVTMRLLVLAAVVALWWQGARRQARWLAVTSLGGLAVQHGLKLAVGRRRPVWEEPLDAANGWAFPSGHTMTATITCGLLLVLVLRVRRIPPVWRVLLWTLAVVSAAGVGITRVVVGVHWPSDVLGGWLFGTAVLAVGTVWLGPGRGRRGASAAPATAAPGWDGEHAGR